MLSSEHTQRKLFTILGHSAKVILFLFFPGGQKSSQDRKEAHKAKRKAKKGEDAANGPSALTAAPTAEALAAVGASQLSKAAQERRQELERSKAAASGTDQSATAPAGHALPAAHAAAGGAAERRGDKARNGHAGHALPAEHAVPAGDGDQAEGEEVSSASSSEGEGDELDDAGAIEVSVS